MSEIFVGKSDRLLSLDELKQLLQNQAAKQKSWFFLREYHQVSGFISQLPDDFASPEGQLFNHSLEIRWKQRGDKFDVLLLSTTGTEPGFIPIGETWAVKQYKALVYPQTETRFPKKIKDGGVNIFQRQFFNPQTSTIHFVALAI